MEFKVFGDESEVVCGFEDGIYLIQFRYVDVRLILSRSLIFT
jgi:hypothetical protein